MFDATRAALIASNAPVQPIIAKTDSGLIAAISLHLVKPNLFSVELGCSLDKAEDLRLIADCKGDTIDAEAARWVVPQAEAFVDAVHARFMGD